MSDGARQIGPGAWRLAAVAVLASGVGLALWRDPALLDDPAFRVPLIAAFAGLCMVPVLLARRAGHKARTAAEAEMALRPGDQPDGGRSAIDLVLGGLGGFLAGALFLSIPGAAHQLTRGPEMVDRLFDMMGPYGVAVVIGGAVALLLVLRLFLAALMAVLSRSRALAAAALGLFLWVPFHTPLQAGLARVGLMLPGLSEATP